MKSDVEGGSVAVQRLSLVELGQERGDALKGWGDSGEGEGTGLPLVSGNDWSDLGGRLR